MEIGSSAKLSLPLFGMDAPRAFGPLGSRMTGGDTFPLPGAEGAAAPEGVRPARWSPSIPQDFIDRQVTVDIETRKVVFQAVDERTGDVIAQFPDPRYLQAYKDQLRAVAGIVDVEAPALEQVV